MSHIQTCAQAATLVFWRIPWFVHLAGIEDPQVLESQQPTKTEPSERTQKSSRQALFVSCMQKNMCFPHLPGSEPLDLEKLQLHPPSAPRPFLCPLLMLRRAPGPEQTHQM